MAETVILLLLGLITLFYVWAKYHYHYWSRRGVAQLPTIPLCGNMLDYILNRKNIGGIMEEIYESHPENDAVGVYALLTPKLLLRSPRLFQKVMVSDFSSFHDNEFYVLKSLDPHFAEDPFCVRGEAWKLARSKSASTTTVGKVRELFPLMKETVARLDAYLKNSEDKYFDAKDLSTLFMMDNVSNCVLGISSNCFTDSQAAFRRMGDLVMKESLQSRWKMIVTSLMPKVRDLLGIRIIPKAVNNFVENMVQEVMADRVKNNKSRNDLFQYFMKKSVESQDPSNEMYVYAMLFFLEGFESSSITASRALYELVMNPDVQQRLYEELREEFGEKFDPDFETINNLTYMDKVIQESQRKYPAVYAFTRLCTKPVSLEIDGKDVKIEPGSPVIIPVKSIQMDHRFFPDPEKFDPERFNEDVVLSRPPYTFMPFGEGPRICTGIKFGLTQVKLLIADLVFNYKLMKCDKTPEKLTFSTESFLVVPNEQEWFKMEKRSK